jgi:c-di-GMP-binding flagellar brake protein YcgR
MNNRAAQPFEDRRRHKRVVLVHEVEYETEVGKFSGRFIDLSVGGMLIETRNALPEETIITIMFNLGRSQDPVVATAEVIYHREKRGMGIP